MRGEPDGQQAEAAHQHLQRDEHEGRIHRRGVAVVDRAERPGQAAEQDQELPAEAGDVKAAFRREDHQHAHEADEEAELLRAGEGRRRGPKVPSQAIQSAGVAFRSAAVFDCTNCIAITWQALLKSTARKAMSGTCRTSVRVSTGGP